MRAMASGFTNAESQKANLHRPFRPMRIEQCRICPAGCDVGREWACIITGHDGTRGGAQKSRGLLGQMCSNDVLPRTVNPMIVSPGKGRKSRGENGVASSFGGAKLVISDSDLFSIGEIHRACYRSLGRTTRVGVYCPNRTRQVHMFWRS